MSHSLSSNSAAHRTSVAHHISRNQLLAALLAFTCMLLGSYRGARGGDVKYVYDELGRLVQVIDATNGNTAIYKYDAVGNLLSITTGSSTPGSSVSISQISPDSGPVGTQVTISGSGFSATATLDSVSFNGAAASISSASANTIVAVVPAGATTGPVIVTSPNGPATAPEPFTVTAQAGSPTITGFTPGSGAPGNSVTIAGTNFQTNPADDHVRFNLADAQITAVTSTSITATVPTHATSGPISVATQLGQAVTSTDFFVTPSGTAYGSQAQTADNTASNVTLAANQQGIVVFNGTQGQSVSIVLSNSTFSTCPVVTVYNPDGTVLESSSYCGANEFFDAVQLSQTGSYTILVNPGNASGSVQVTVYNASVTTGTIAFGTPVTVAASVPGQDTKLTFSANAGQQISLVISGNTMAGGPTIFLYRPDGALMTYTQVSGSGGFIDSTTLPKTGTYTILVDPENATGSATLTLYNAPNLIGSIGFMGSPNGGPVTVAAGVPGQDTYLTFNATSGQQISFVVSNNNIVGGPNVVIFNPDGSQLANLTVWNGGVFLDSTTLAQTGTYTIFIDSGDATGSMTLALYNAPTQIGTIASPSPGNPGSATVTSSAPGQDTKLTFSGSTGQQLSLVVSNNSISGGPVVTIYNPDGSQLASTQVWPTGGNFVDSTTLQQTGTYTIFIDTGSSTGSMTLTLYDTTTQTGTISIGGSATATSNAPGQDARLTFKAVPSSPFTTPTARSSHQPRCGRPGATSSTAPSFHRLGPTRSSSTPASITGTPARRA
jgi:YD repeat-containing protein